MSTSSSGVGPAMMVVVKPLLAVARADPRAIPPKAQATRTPANIDFELLMVELPPQLVIAARAQGSGRQVDAHGTETGRDAVRPSGTRRTTRARRSEGRDSGVSRRPVERSAKGTGRTGDEPVRPVARN